jgi:hypothetical protein
MRRYRMQSKTSRGTMNPRDLILRVRDHGGFDPHQVAGSTDSHNASIARDFWSMNDAGETLRRMVRGAGVEPTTFGSGGRRSIQLSYPRMVAARHI